MRALVILDGLIQNAGGRFQRTFADEPLLERLRLLARDEAVDPRVRQKSKILFAQWANAYKNTAGLERIATLHKELPKTQRPVAARQKVLKETGPFDSPEDLRPPISEGSRSRSNSHQKSAQTTPSRPVTLSQTTSSLSAKLFKEKKSGTEKPFSLSKEKINMTNAIAQASIASTNLLNGLQLINRERERVSDNLEVIRRLEACKTLRRKILYYIQHVESDEWIGSLVNANDDLVKALTAYEIMDRSIDDDSDSDGWEETLTRTAHVSAQEQLAGLSLSEAAPAKPPRPIAPSTIKMPVPPTAPAASAKTALEDEEDDDPFGDSHAAQTPYHELSGMTWKEV